MSDLRDKDGHLLPVVGEDLEAMGFDEASLQWSEQTGLEDDELIWYDSDGWPWASQDWRKYLG